MGKKVIVGVIGGGEATPETLAVAERLGELIAEKGWVLLNGGRSAGVMDASARGAKRRGGLTVGILPSRDNRDRGTSEHIDIPIYTGMGDARNCVNILSSDVIIACPGREGTISEVALALKNGKPVIFLGFEDQGLFRSGPHRRSVRDAATPEEAVRKAEEVLADRA
ncbi:MAG: TIGR00725 family protein [Nitrospirae bacterium]|nr:TIGR00725 family protein [Nitrospirota bacterium]